MPRLAVLLHERDDILESFTEKSDEFARTFVDHGTFGFLPGEPSAWTQPLYSFFLIPIYWVAGREWWSVGFAQIAVAAAHGARRLRDRAALPLASRGARRRGRGDAQPVPRLARRPRQPRAARPAAGGGRRPADARSSASGAAGSSRRRCSALALGLAILGNSRLILLPLVIAGYLLWRRKGWQTVGVTLAACVIALVPWLVRNRGERRLLHAHDGLARALEGEQPQHVRHARPRRWIDDVPNLPGAPPWPELAADLTKAGTPTSADECAQMRLYRREVIDFWQEHPGEKARLMAQAARMLWDPRRSVPKAGQRRAASSTTPRTWVQPLYTIPLYVLAVIGLVVMPRRIAVLFVALLAYNTLAALVFAGATRYRVPWDFVLALAAGAAVVSLLDRWRPAR